MSYKNTVLIENCNILPRQGTPNIRSILIEGNRIVALSESPTQRANSDALKIDAFGATVLPGLTDSHCHLVEVGSLPRVIDLRGANSMTSIRLRLFTKVQRATAGEWIIGKGWDQEVLVERRFPRRDEIDDLTDKNPTILLRSCGHVGLLNSRALDTLGIAESTQDPPGGSYSRDEGGMLDGLVKETALDAALSLIPTRTADQLEADILMGEYEAARSGITTVHCFLSQHYVNELEAFEGLRDAGRLSLRFRLYPPAGGLDHIRRSGIVARLNDEMIRINGIKIYADGSLGARTAALTSQYSDDPGNSGVLRYSDFELRSLIAESDALGMQVAIHAVGDRAISQSLDAISDSKLPVEKSRPRIEHASLTPPDLLSRIEEMKAAVSLQPHFVVSDDWAEARLGKERVADLYAFRSIIERGIVASGGSDAPIESLSPFLGLWAAASGAGQWTEQRLSIDEAVDLYTANSAKNGFDENDVGIIREGGLADLTLLDSNIDGIHPSLIRRVGIAATIVNGRVVYSYEGLT